MKSYLTIKGLSLSCLLRALFSASSLSMAVRHSLSRLRTTELPIAANECSIATNLYKH